MGKFGGFYKGEKKKLSKEEMARKNQKYNIPSSSFKLPEIIRKKKED